MSVIAIAGGHGKIARQLTRDLHAAGQQVVAIVRNPDHVADVESDGARAVVLDLESADVADLAPVLRGADAVVFAAGAGPGSGAGRKDTMDRGGSVLLADAAVAAGVPRFVQISSIGTDQADAPGVDPVFAAYLRAKKAAEDDLRTRDDLDWTIVRPGVLTDSPATGLVTISTNDTRDAVPRADIAAVIARILLRGGFAGRTVTVIGGDTPIDAALDPFNTVLDPFAAAAQPLGDGSGDPARATSFGSVGAAYDSARPEYPAEAVAWMLSSRPRRVVDVGAGTGKLTRAVAATGAEVTAVDPDARMLEQLSARNPEIRTFVGSGESLPLPDDSADAVVYGQAWHWVEPLPAAAEAGRVLVPGGVLGLIWNIRDTTDPFTRELSLIIGDSPAERMDAEGGVQIPEPFGPADIETFHWTRTLDVDTLLGMVSSRSMYIAAGPEEKRAVDAAVRDLAGDGDVELKYLTRVYRATLLA